MKKKIAILTLFRPLLKKSTGYIYTNSAELEDSIFKKKNIVVIPNGVYENIINNKETSCPIWAGDFL